MIQSIGRYRVEGTIGRGGMGVVYRAFDPMLQRTVALKVISGIALDEGSARERLLREARAAGQLTHRNIVVIHDLGEDQGQPYLAMEYLTGSSLDAHLRQGPLPLTRIIDFGAQLCDGLEYAHQRGLVHRDIKPANLFVTDSGDLKILDFGLVQLATSSLTRSQTVMGTASYMAPEQVRGERVDHRVDIFAAGAVLYELVARRKAFDGDSYATTMYKILQDQPEPLVQFAPDLPQAFITAVARALAKEPGDRYQRAADMRRDLDACRNAIATHLASRASILPSRAVVDVEARPSRFRSSRVPAAAAGIALIAAGGIWYWSSDRLPPARSSEPESVTAASATVAAVPAREAIAPSPDADAQANQTPSTAPPALPVAPAREAAASQPAPSPPPNIAGAADRRAITAAAIRAEQARSAADADEARTLAPGQYAAAAALEADARALADTAPVTEVTAKFVEAEARFRAAAIEARAEARARTTAAPPPQNTAASPSASSPPAAPAAPAGDAGTPTLDASTRDGGAVPAPADNLPRRSPVSTEALIREVVAQYIAALEGRSMAALKRVWPTLTGAQERAIQSEFANATSVRARFSDSRTSIDGNTATVTGTREYRLVTQDGQQLSTVTGTTFTLRRTGDTWHIERIVHQAR